MVTTISCFICFTTNLFMVATWVTPFKSVSISYGFEFYVWKLGQWHDIYWMFKNANNIKTKTLIVYNMINSSQMINKFNFNFNFNFVMPFFFSFYLQLLLLLVIINFLLLFVLTAKTGGLWIDEKRIFLYYLTLRAIAKQ